MMIRKFTAFTVLLMCAMVPLGQSADQGAAKLGSSNESMNKILLQGKIIDQGHNYFRSLQFERALAEYRKATEPQYLVSNDSKYYPLSLVIKCLEVQGKYEEGLTENNWYLAQKVTKPVQVESDKRLKALLAWQKTRDRQMVDEYITYIKNEYAKMLPPKRLMPPSNLVFTDIAMIYDLLNDYDLGIEWAESFKKATKDKRYKEEYDNVSKAFEESKQGMPEICGDGGKTCVGRATAYIIQSDQL